MRLSFGYGTHRHHIRTTIGTDNEHLYTNACTKTPAYDLENNPPNEKDRYADT